MNSHIHLSDDQSEAVGYRSYKLLISSMTIIRPDISFEIEKLSQFMGNPRKVHWEIATIML